MRLGATESLGIVFTEPRRVELQTERLPRLHRRVALEARCTLVSTGTERRCFEGDFAPDSQWAEWVRYPFRPGYSFAGVTERGERVCAEAPHAQRVLVPAANLFPIPDGVSDEDASWFTLAAIAQSGLAKVSLGAEDAVVVVGAGVLGQLVAQLARVAGAGKVIVLARSRPRLEVAAAHGATDVVAGDVSAAKEEVLSLTGGGASVVFEVTGNPAAFAGSLKLARKGGTVVLIGDVGDPAEQRLGGELLNNDLHVAGAHIMNTDDATRRRMAAEFFAALQAGTVVVKDLITTRSRPADAADVYASLSDGDAGRLGVLFDWA